MALACLLTLSRGGIVAALLALFVYLVLATDRLPKLLTLLVAGVGSAILIAATTQRDALQDGLGNAAAHQQGDQVLLMTLAVCAVAGLLQVAIGRLLRDDGRPSWTRVSRRAARFATAATLLAVLIVAIGSDAPGRAADAWGEFKGDGGPGTGTDRLGSVAGENRYQFWKAALDQVESEPLTGTGSGTFEYWWARNGETTDIVRDTHSLYMQTLGELGIVGFLLLIGFLATVFVAGGLAIASRARERPYLAAAIAGIVAFCLTAAFDWVWQNPVLPIVLLLLASVLVTARARATADAGAALAVPLRVGFAVAAIAAIAAIAIPLAFTTLLRQSEADARAGDLDAALGAARSAENVFPAAAAPRLQQALVLEELGDLAAASAAARGAAEREPTNWRNWLVLSRLEARQGNAAAAVRDYRRAESLNPHFSLFAR
jgi:tetratricopeptide (TPR) repeat protein